MTGTAEAPPEDPFATLRGWLPPNEDPARPTMTLATVDADGLPDARTVLLSEWDADGFAFHTDSRSAKVAELTARPVAALVLHLPGARQLVVRGPVGASGAEQRARVYAMRTPYLRELAWLNTDAFALLPTAERERRWAAFAAEHPDPAPPDTWTGFVVRPDRLLLWEGATGTASRRLDYARAGSGWSVAVRAG